MIGLRFVFCFFLIVNQCFGKYVETYSVDFQTLQQELSYL